MTPQQELEEATRNSLLKATGPDGDLIRDFAAQMRQDRIMAAVILKAVEPERYTADSLEEYRYQWAMGKIKTFPTIGELVEAAG